MTNKISGTTKTIVFAAALLMTVTAVLIISAPQGSDAAGGAGTAEDPYIISNAADLSALAAEVNGGDDKAGKYYLLSADLDLGGNDASPVQWTPIGYDGSHAFKGTFDGNGHEISNIRVDGNTSRNYAGLFGYVYNGTVKDLNIHGVRIAAQKYVGGITGYLNNGSIINCHIINRGLSEGGTNANQIFGTDCVGGIAGMLNVSSRGIEGCSFSGLVWSKKAYQDIYVNHIEPQYNPASPADNLGGLAGYLAMSRVSGSYAEGIVMGRNSVGGLVGHISGGATPALVENSFYSFYVRGARYVGGIVGDVNAAQANENAVITNCYSVGYVTGATSVGGIAGYLRGTLIDSAALVNWTEATDTNPGRIVGVKHAESTVSGNAAFSRMMYDDAGSTLAEGSSAMGKPFTGDPQLDGTRITSQDVFSDGTIGGRFSEPVWVIENGKLPVFTSRPLEFALSYLSAEPITEGMFNELPDFVYTGSENRPSVTAIYPEVTFEIVEYNNNVNAGTGSVTIRGTGDYYVDTVIVTLYFTIAQADSHYAAPDDLTGVYEDTLSDVALPAGWQWVTGSDPLITGMEEYAATFTQSDPNYKSSVTVMLMVNTERKSVPIPTIRTGLTGTGSQQVGVNYDSSGTYYTWSGDVSEIGPGSFTATFTLLDKNNYMWADGTTEDVVLNWTIGTAAGAASVSKAGFTYDGTPGSVPIVNVVSGNWTKTAFEYSTSSVFTTILSTPPTDAGTYHVRAVLSESSDGSFADLTTDPATYTIGKRDITSMSGSAIIMDVTYSGLAFEPVPVIAGLTHGTDYVAVNYANNIHAGTATLTVNGVGNCDGTFEMTFTILKKIVTVTPDQGQSNVYGDGLESTIEYMVTGLAGTDSRTVLDGTLSRESGSNAGEYGILIGTLSHPDYTIYLVPGVYTIEKAVWNDPTLTLVSHTRDSITAKAIDGEEYSINGSEWQDSNVFTGLSPDTDYVISVRLKADANHEASSIVSASAMTSGTDPDGASKDPWWPWLPVGLLIGAFAAAALWFGWVEKKDTEEESS